MKNKHQQLDMKFLLPLLFSFQLCFSQTIKDQYHIAPKSMIYLWEGEVPMQQEKKGLPKISTQKKTKDLIRVGTVTNPALVVYEPKHKKSDIAVIICPGGAYAFLAIDKEGYEVAEWFNSLGITAFVLQYRVPKKQEAALIDMQRAIRLVRSKAIQYNINPQKIGVLGFSAGGNLCARASTRFTEQLYPLNDAVDKLSCRPDFSVLVYPAYLDKGDDRSLSPDLNVSNDTPPFFIFGTSDDRFGNGSLVMTQALRDQKKSVSLHFLAEGGHGYGLRKGNNAAEKWPILLLEWLKENNIL